jgi:Flp pilus assembly protein TadG
MQRAILSDAYKRGKHESTTVVTANKSTSLRAAKGRFRRGAILIYVAVALVVFAVLASLVVDVGHMRLVKNQLQFGADAAARHATQGLGDGTAAAKAISAAAANTVDGAPLVLQNADVVTGTWSTGTFTAGGSSPNAVMVTAYHNAARGTAVKVWWGGLLGKSSADLSAISIATATSGQITGFIGFSAITMTNNTFFGSYDSANNINPSEGSAGSSAWIGSNGSISGGNNTTVSGNAELGPSGSLSGITVSGSTQTKSSALPTPTLPTWSPSNPTDYTVSSNTTLPGGTYWYNSLTVNANLTFTGPATVYVNGNIVVDATLAPSSGVPSDLTIYQYGSNTFGDSGINGMNITATVIAPGCDFIAKNNLTFRGEGLFNSITTKNSADFFYDTQIGPGGGARVVSIVQ